MKKTYNMMDIDPYLESFIKARMSDKFQGLKRQKMAADVALEVRVKEFIQKIAGDHPKHRQDKWRRRRSVLLSSHFVHTRTPINSGKGQQTTLPLRSRPITTAVVEHNSSAKNTETTKPPLNVESSSLQNSEGNIKNGRNQSDANIDSGHIAKDNNLTLDKTLKMPDINTSDQKAEKTTNCRHRCRHTKSHNTKESGESLPDLMKHKNKDLNNPSLWPGDPKAIGSIRRPRKNAEEMLAAFRSGEEARKLVREMILPCSKNCNKPDYVTEMERMSVELPSLIPAIKKARRDLKQEMKDVDAHSIYVATEVHSALTLAPFKIENIYDKLYYDKKLIVMTHTNSRSSRSS